MRPQSDDYPDHIERVLERLLEEGVDAGAEVLEVIAYPPREIPKRRPITRSTSVRILQRDNFTCRYCGGRTILSSVMELLGEIYPESFPFHPNWKGGVTHPAFVSRSPAVDHVVPAALGGGDDDDNLVNACNPCNSIKSDFSLDVLGWSLRPIEESDWQGLTEYYRSLWNFAGRPKPEYHSNWMALLNL